MNNNITQDYLKTILDYNQDTGVFTWKVKRFSHANKVNVGVIANNKSVWGYCRIGIDGKRYMAHRLAWLYVYGSFPPNQIDHINRDRGDNRICNLRLSSQGENMQNISLNCKNTSGFKGVSWDKKAKKWYAKITHQYKQIPLGLYDVVEDAAKAYSEAKKKYHTFNPEPT